ncbi:MAG: DUF433 domain-containing protein [Bacteroidetes bacterium]|jgi:uncharacterized protein (DUF433 family)|nr:MAG: DUF433 domain-containing protein [Bacteroidota bacterium]
MNNIKLHKTITIEAGKRSDKPCIRGLRISTYDIIGWLKSGMTIEQIISDYPELNKRDIQSCVQFMEEFNAHRTSIATLQINETFA